MADRQMLVAPVTVQRGRVIVVDRPGFDATVARWTDCDAVLRLEEARDVRRAALVAYYWGVVVDAVSEATGYTPTDAHRLLKTMHLSPRLHAMRGGAVCDVCARILGGSTRQMSGLEQWRYIERIHMWAAVQGVYIPDPIGVQ